MDAATVGRGAETGNPYRLRRVLLDLLLGGLMLVVLFPAMVVLAMLSALSFRAWPIFTQERIGRGGRPFVLMKIRSLPPETPTYADKYAIEGVRRTRFGSFVRSTHLDELPQLVLVVGGRMSLVGPRPEMDVVAKTFDPAFMAVRTRLRPGCTGLWQVSVDADKLIGESPSYDLFYVEHNCVQLDLWILWRTAVQLAPRVQGVTLADIPPWAHPRKRRSVVADSYRGATGLVASAVDPID